jgi:hypothetical protein
LTKDKLTFDKYLVFDLKRVGDTCRIDTIRFLTDPDSAADAVLTPGADTTDPVIREIKREYAQLHAGNDKFRIVAKDIMDESTEGGDDTLYFEGAQLRRASVELMGETGKIKMDYYFAHGQLFFYISRETRKDLYPAKEKELLVADSSFFSTFSP